MLGGRICHSWLWLRHLRLLERHGECLEERETRPGHGSEECALQNMPMSPRDLSISLRILLRDLLRSWPYMALDEHR